MDHKSKGISSIEPCIISNDNAKSRLLVSTSKIIAGKAGICFRLDDLAAQCKVSKKTIYRYFKNKNQLITETATMDYHQLIEALLNTFNQKKSKEAKLNKALELMTDFCLKYCSKCNNHYDGESGFGKLIPRLLRDASKHLSKLIMPWYLPATSKILQSYFIVLWTNSLERKPLQLDIGEIRSLLTPFIAKGILCYESQGPHALGI